MIMMKDRIKKVVKVDKTIIESTKSFEALDQLAPCDLDQEFYTDLNDQM